MPVAFRNGTASNITQYKNPPPKKEKRKEVRNMKHVKKLFAMLMAVMMLVGLLSVTSFAADKAPLTDHTYEAYQIFKGTQAADSAVLGNLDWGTGIKSDDFLTALKADATIGSAFATCTTAQDVAKVVAGWGDSSDNAKAFAKVAYANKSTTKTACVNGQTGLDAGYYLVVDTTNVAGKDDVKNLALLQLTNKGTFEIASKVDQPKVEKKVKDINDSKADSLTGWQDSADYDIGDSVPFQLKATLGTIADYDTYKVVFHDTMSKGLTYDANSAVVKIYKDGDVTNTAETNVVTVTANFTFATAAATDTEGAYVGGNTLTWSCADVKALGAKDNSVITVEYTAKLNENANIGSAGNPNEVYLEYSNNPNESGSGNNNTGKTPEDKVIVFTYKVVVNKVDGEKKALPGAEFTLYKKNVENEYVEVTGKLTKNAAGTEFTWTGIDDGDYKLVETTTPAGYNTAADILFTVTATHDVLADNPALTSLTGTMADGSVTTLTPDKNAGTLTGDVVNNVGSTLPETGGMGTYIFYAVGGVLVLAAVVLFVTKKRMSNAD